MGLMAKTSLGGQDLVVPVWLAVGTSLLQGCDLPRLWQGIKPVSPAPTPLAWSTQLRGMLWHVTGTVGPMTLSGRIQPRPDQHLVTQLSGTALPPL